MARFTEPTPDQFRDWKAWIARMPPHVRVIAEHFEPWSLYRLRTTGQRCFVQSFSETAPVTLNVGITGEFNHVAFDRAVYGVRPEDLEPCELPQPGEHLGTVMTAEEVVDNIDALRAHVRPDLWVLDEDGVAQRKH